MAYLMGPPVGEGIEVAAGLCCSRCHVGQFHEFEKKWMREGVVFGRRTVKGEGGGGGGGLLT